MNFRIHIEQDEDGKFIASCPTLPGCWSQGDTAQQAQINLVDAISGIVASKTKRGDTVRDEGVR